MNKIKTSTESSPLVLASVKIGGICEKLDGTICMRIWHEDDTTGKLVSLADGLTYSSVPLYMKLKQIFPAGTKIELEVGE